MASTITTALLCLLALSLAPFPTHSADPDPLQDLCVADMKATPPVNGFPCKPASEVVAKDFISNALIRGGDTKNVFKSNVTQGTVNQFPGLNTLGLSINRVDFAYGGLNPPHSHPRATEAGVIAKGTFLIGFITTDNKLFTNKVYPGQIFVIPRGLVHFQKNIGEGEGLIFTVFNSQNPGAAVIPTTLFASDPEIYDAVLSQTFQIDDKVVDKIRDGVAGVKNY